MNALQGLTGAEVSQVTHTIQLAVAPVFLLAGIVAFINVCASRLARVIDRARALERIVLESSGGKHDRAIDEIHVLDRRIRVVNRAILLSVLSALLICAVVILLFASNLFDVNMGTVIALFFIGSMLSIGGGFALFIHETRLGSRVIHIRNEILYHRVEEEKK